MPDELFNLISLIQMLLNWRITLGWVSGMLLGHGCGSLIPHETFSTVVFITLMLGGAVAGFVWDHRSRQDR
jgi:hypothetical protein